METVMVANERAMRSFPKHDCDRIYGGILHILKNFTRKRRLRE